MAGRVSDCTDGSQERSASLGGGLGLLRGPVGTRRGHGVVGIGSGQQAGQARELGGGRAAVVAGTVQPLVVQRGQGADAARRASEWRGGSSQGRSPSASSACRPEVRAVVAAGPRRWGIGDTWRVPSRRTERTGAPAPGARPGAGAIRVEVESLLGGDGGRGALWSRETDDLDVNVVAFPAGAGVAAHVNAEVDVLLVVVAGEGRARVGSRAYRLAAGTALLIPKGVTRAIHCTRGRLVYLTCHRRRGRLQPAALLRSATPAGSASGREGVEP